jgi:N1-aminopropylagmatine ureohydrolase
MAEATRFLGIDDPADDGYAVAVLPAPLERTVSYGAGTAAGPAALLAASTQVELYDEELAREAWTQGIRTLPPVDFPAGAAMSELLDGLRRRAAEVMSQGRFLATIGGEHSLTIAPVRAALERFGPLGVVQFDAHADLRDRYEGSEHSHACVMRRVHDLGLPSLAVGIRAISSEEAELIDAERLRIIWGRQLDALTPAAWLEALDALPERLYLTFDVDFFDPSLLPATGTPEPGGGVWYPTLRLLRALFERKEVVAMDVVELAPSPGQPTSDFVAARLLYKCLGYRLLRAPA